MLSPVINVGPANLDSPEFVESCRRLAASLGIGGRRWRAAWEAAREAQLDFDRRCFEIGGRVLAFCAERDVLPIVVLGRPYTIYNTVLNSNVPALLREQGALAIPLDCYPVDRAVPVFSEMYWAYGQRVLRAAHQIRRTPGVYGLYASNYSCGPDSFNLHFCAHVMEGKPFAVIETDGHSGDAGTKTRIEAFLHCVREDRSRARGGSAPSDFGGLARAQTEWRGIQDRGEVLLIPRMSGVAEMVAACFRGLGMRAECLPEPDAEALRLGRRQTSGKECLPMCITLGSLLQRAARSPRARRAVCATMPRGGHRFGATACTRSLSAAWARRPGRPGHLKEAISRQSRRFGLLFRGDDLNVRTGPCSKPDRSNAGRAHRRDPTATQARLAPARRAHPHRSVGTGRAARSGRRPSLRPARSGAGRRRTPLRAARHRPCQPSWLWARFTCD